MIGHSPKRCVWGRQKLVVSCDGDFWVVSLAFGFGGSEPIHGGVSGPPDLCMLSAYPCMNSIACHYSLHFTV